MSDLSVFVFESQEVRFVGTPEKLEWVAADIVAILYPQADSLPLLQLSGQSSCCMEGS
ncbi:hypothetical protein LC613_40985 [Nostoc sphaeroides CHAB 2801]|uniref:hypothetical protein n=1 Tax=Nostoc sphaeroides TaxID=446679 RepID=UPI001E480EBB|nr:hypothetical protein [Nostoc sphaeroides]MCC5633796.1 hypothetical protein [Nostoc sphaeroides CHAB 2801]